jgi:hypothetical protein
VDADDAKELVSDPLENKFINSKMCFMNDVSGCLKVMAEDPMHSLIAVQGMSLLTTGVHTSALAVTAAVEQQALCKEAREQRKSKMAKKHQEMVSALRFIPLFRPQLHNLNLTRLTFCCSIAPSRCSHRTLPTSLGGGPA